MPNKNEADGNTKERAVGRVERGKKIETRTSRTMKKKKMYNAIKKKSFISFKFGLRC
jgi:hypothetical protein